MGHIYCTLAIQFLFSFTHMCCFVASEKLSTKLCAWMCIEFDSFCLSICVSSLLCISVRLWFFLFFSTSLPEYIRWSCDFGSRWRKKATTTTTIWNWICASMVFCFWRVEFCTNGNRRMPINNWIFISI